ncbi:hypothetical protein HBH63_128640 [Parastagonospora nodorum]|nr:hypothetical protein HBH63_128640 [Parastagonospora nodorum]
MTNTEQKGLLKACEPLIQLPACEHATTRPSPDTYGPIVTVVVGSECDKKEFHIHGGLLQHYSSYFRRAMKPEWTRDATDRIELKQEDPALFQIVFHWFYSGKLYSTPAANGQVPVSEPDLCKIFVVGDCRGIPELCNAAINLLFQRFANEWAYACRCLNYIYTNTIAGSCLRSLFVDLAVSSFSFDKLKENESSYPKEFLIDVVLRSRELKTWPGNVGSKKGFLENKAAEICKYHDHKDPHII